MAKLTQTRTLQRAGHLATGLAVVAYLYLTPPPGSPAELTVRWIVAPLLVASGIAMWQWPRLRRRSRRESTRASRRERIQG